MTAKSFEIGVLDPCGHQECRLDAAQNSDCFVNLAQLRLGNCMVERNDGRLFCCEGIGLEKVVAQV